jgi:EamA domain-containing membrane protein RarD
VQAALFERLVAAAPTLQVIATRMVLSPVVILVISCVKTKNDRLRQRGTT